MNEFIGLAYYAEVPAVIFDVQRTGPSTGMPTRTQQCDLMMCAYASHGDTRHICIYPGDPREAFEFAASAFDLAERFQTPVFVLTDLDIGMNDWMVPKLTWDDNYRPDRGKVLSAEELDEVKSFARYIDADGDGIAPRTLPGVHPSGAYFTRGSGHNRFGAYTEDSEEYVEVIDRIDRKIQRAARAVPQPIVQLAAGARVGLVTVGGCHAACTEALDRLAADGIAVNYMRVRGLPLRRRGGRLPRATRRELHRRAESRRAASQPAAARDRRRGREAGAGSLLRRVPDERPSRDRRRQGQTGESGVTYIAKPTVHHPALQKNAIGLIRRDYEGSLTTLCAGCGHDSITAAIIQAFWELSIPPHRVAKLSGIGCSSKTPAYFLREAHGFNGVHGRMPALVTGANAANRDIIYIGVSGDGDSLSIGLGQLCHAIRRNVNVLYVLENNGVYGLTKGQFSASADPGSLSKKGEPNTMEAIDGCLLALALGATFVARGFSGDKAQLVPIIKAGLSHAGFAFIDVISPCVTFNDHEGSTKSYAYTREKNVEVVQADFVLPTRAITTDYEPGSVQTVTLHDGSAVRLRKVAEQYDPTDRDRAYAYIRERQKEGEIVTGLLYLSPDSSDLHEQNDTVATPLTQLSYEELCPGSAELDKLQARFR